MDFRNAAVLCAWDLDVIASTTVLACGRERQQADDAIDQAIAAMDDYIVANSSGNETKETLEKKRQFIVQKILSTPTKVRELCGPHGVSDRVRSASPDAIVQGTKRLFSLPRDRMGDPCAP
jgi:hypothetical protein